MAGDNRDEYDDDDVPFTKAELDLSMDNVIVVDNLPVVPPEKVEKLAGILLKLYSKIGAIVEDGDYNGLHMPMDDEKGMSKGFAFIEFVDKKSAVMAVEQTDGHKLDKNHVFSVCRFPEFHRIVNVPDQYEAPQPPQYKERGNLREWLLDPKARDQYVIRYTDESEIYWNDTVDVKESDRLVFSRKKWTDTGHQWSPHGTYVVTFHRPGLRLWGGQNFEAAGRFMHNNVKLVDFSPCETYLVTVTWADRASDKEEENAIIIWDVRTGEKKRGFKNDGAKDKPVEPFKWSHDGKYFAKIADESIQVYSTEDFKLLDKKSFKLPGVKEFHWSPSQNIMAAFVPGSGDGQTPARVVPSRKELRQKNLFSVSDIQMHWHPDGTYLCVKVDRQKSKKTTTYSFELFRIKERDIPIEVLEIKDSVVAFAWEPKGHRFCLVHGEQPRPDISFYTMLKEGKAAVSLLKTLEKKPVNELFWSPMGHHIVLAGLKNLNGMLNFYNVDEMESMNEDEHFLCTDLVWDPTGRYVCTYVSAFRQPMENGYTIWNFAGRPQLRTAKDKFFQFLWRPRPPSLLTAKQEKEIRKQLAEYSQRYTEEDRKAKELAETAHLREREAKRKTFEEGEAIRKQLYMQWQEERRELRGCLTDDEDLYEFVEETFEEVLEVKEERI
ncbi:translation initiation factor 3, subunit B [Guillardia theta CCMP2712]|uniref:Eukaryotic translation initiation factor 3 subunit B n=1 Tax=Guillardia theta (strain CCMP2712) TaxID=905079 RepID=L1J3Q7_GUITC|nr:translation initiation factor 3, subunit B [Guillardia theta CCMP2712]EKX42947.1 translation initiation factor 3, subunit B [Guillardia theta CCMP2712]|eukprot:XP_005829927.1 translation initiation factor 3, subunit B [Guillardia theta CCMP2712]